MTLSEYRKTQSWQGAIALGPGLINLAEALPASEEMGLSFQLRQLMVDLPAAVASDLLHGTDTRNQPILRLLATIELVDKVYPALDTAGVRAQVDKVAEQLTGLAFQQELTPPSAATEESPEPESPAPAADTEPVAVNVPVEAVPSENEPA